MKQAYDLRDTILYLDNVELGYGQGSDYKCILKDVNLIEQDVVREGKITGQTIAIVGRSGRGKSTLFRALVGLVEPRNGQILLTELESEDTTDAKIVKEGDIGFVDQKYTLFRNKTVFKILMAAQNKNTFSLMQFLKHIAKLKPLRYLKESGIVIGKTEKNRRKEVVNSYLEIWGLTKQRDQYPCELSGGQRQRTAIIEQILTSGHFMVLDEPFSGLDVGNIQSCKDAFNLIQEQHELNTIIFSTHDMKLAVELADSIYVVGNKEGYEDYATIVKHFDLKEMGLAWQPYGLEHLKFTEELTEFVKTT